MTKAKKADKASPYYLPNELYMFDILIKFERDKQPSLHYDDQMQQVFNTLAQEHEVFLLKINWSDPSLHLIIPPQDLMHLFTEVPQQEAEKTE
jgi:hypothetical protein